MRITLPALLIGVAFGYFDGVISGASAMRTAYSGIGDEWVATMLNTVAPKDATGKASPRAALSDSEKKA